MSQLSCSVAEGEFCIDFLVFKYFQILLISKESKIIDIELLHILNTIGFHEIANRLNDLNSMKFFDAFLQSCSIIIPLISMNDARITERMAMIGLTLGPIQIVSSIISILTTEQYRQEKLIYLILSILFFACLFLCIFFDVIRPRSPYMPYYFLGFPFLLGAYYYYVTLRSAFQ